MKEDIKLEDVLYSIAKTLEYILDRCEYGGSFELEKAKSSHRVLIEYLNKYGVKISKKVRFKWKHKLKN